MRFLLGLVLAVGFSFADRGFSWGNEGHKLINRAALHFMTSPLKQLLNTNASRFSAMSLVPDDVWKQQGDNYEMEKGTHFFEWDIYQDTAIGSTMPLVLEEAADALSANRIIRNGSAVWRVNQVYERLVISLKNRNWVEVVQYAGVLGHYVGDLTQPMHITSDYDGQSIDRRGIHKYYEIDLVNKQSRDELFEDVLQEGGKRFLVKSGTDGLDIVTTVFEQAVEALEKLPALLEIFSGRGSYDDEKLKPHMVEGLSFAATQLALILDQAYVEAESGEDFPTNTLRVGNPPWLPFHPCQGLNKSC